MTRSRRCAIAAGAFAGGTSRRCETIERVERYAVWATRQKTAKRAAHRRSSGRHRTAGYGPRDVDVAERGGTPRTAKRDHSARDAVDDDGGRDDSVDLPPASWLDPRSRRPHEHR